MSGPRTFDDRVRTALHAHADQIRDIRPLTFPDELPAPVRRRERNRRWLGWGAPIAAAAMVTALALVLVQLRQAPGQQSASASASATASATASVPAAIPEYYVTLQDAGTITYRSAVTGKMVTTSSNARMEALVGDDRTGKRLAVISSSENIYDVTAATDDRTFALEESPVGGHATTFYLLRLTPGGAHPTQLTKLPIAPIVANIYGFTLSADGTKLAVMWRTATTATNAVAHLQVYSVPSGALLGTWQTYGSSYKELDNGLIGDGGGLTWINGDSTVEFPWANAVPTTGPVKVYDPTTKKMETKTETYDTDQPTFRTLDTTAGGDNLITDSRTVALSPSAYKQGTGTIETNACANALLSSDGTIVCGSTGSATGGAPGCPAADPTFSRYSPSGKLLQVLYRFQAQCLSAQADVYWTNSTGTTIIAHIGLSQKGIKVSSPSSNRFGVISDGHLTVLPPLLAGDYANIAF